MENISRVRATLYTLITVFFFWGFIAAGNSVFIPFCKHYFHLDQFQSQLIDFAFYLAYYIGALGLFAVGAFTGKDAVARWGYRKSIVYGLLFSAIGALTMIVAVNANSFNGMLGGLFIVALGFSLQQTAANPFALALGDPKTGAHRISLGGSVNSFGTTIGPIVIGLALFGSAKSISDEQIQNLKLEYVNILYACVGALFIGAAALFYFSKNAVEGVQEEEAQSTQETKPMKAFLLLAFLTLVLAAAYTPIFNSYRGVEAQEITALQKQIDSKVLTGESLTQANAHLNELKVSLESFRTRCLMIALASIFGLLLFSLIPSRKNKNGWGAMQYPQLVLGMLAIFVYVGVEVSIGSNLGELLKQKAFGGFEASQIAVFASVYWGSLMVGRWTGAINVFEWTGLKKQMATVIVPILAFGLVLGVNALAQKDVSTLYGYVVCVLLQVAVFFISRGKPALTLLLFSIGGALAMLVGILSSGQVAIYAILSGGLFCSIMWPSIFSLSLAGLGSYTTQGAAFLVMMILGGSVLPPIQGKLADWYQSMHPEQEGIGIHQSYWLAFACFVFLALFAVVVKQLLQKQGIDYDENSAGH